jgi:hypothetical protein
VLAHLPFYFVLLPQFIKLSYSRLSGAKTEAAARDLLAVLAALAASQPLLDLLRSVEAAFTRCAAGVGAAPLQQGHWRLCSARQPRCSAALPSSALPLSALHSSAPVHAPVMLDSL